MTTGPGWLVPCSLQQSQETCTSSRRIDEQDSVIIASGAVTLASAGTAKHVGQLR